MTSENYTKTRSSPIYQPHFSDVKLEPLDSATEGTAGMFPLPILETHITNIKQEPLDIKCEPPTAANADQTCSISGGNVNIAQISTTSSSTEDQKQQKATIQSASHQPRKGRSSININKNGEKRRRVKRVACTCSNCKNGENNSGYKKQHTCHIAGCNKIYRKTSHLRAHLRWHVGEHPFVCSWIFCGKSFTRSDKLQRHYRTHTGEKTYQCCECNKKFMRSDHLSKHIKTHYKSQLDLADISIKDEEHFEDHVSLDINLDENSDNEHMINITVADIDSESAN